ncbi:MAG: ABC transporter permease [Planctomycetota bacterium]|nr:MAG: ABC transporter permease [Planctomycetota bacterium]
MSKILTVAQREFIETVKTRTFLFSSLLMPLLIIGLIFGGERIAKVTEGEQQPVRTIAVIDRTGVMAAALGAQLKRYNEENSNRPLAFEMVDPQTTSIDELRRRVNDGELYGVLEIPPEVLKGPAPCSLSRRDSHLQLGRAVQRLVQAAVVDVRFERADPPIDLERVRALQAPISLRHIDVSSGEDTSGSMMAQFMTPFAFMFLLFMGTMNISTGLLTSLIEEKSTRVIEVLLSAISPLQLMAGKILGMVAVGALLMLIWGTVGYVSAQWRDMEHLVTPYRLTYVVLYFIPGFLLVAAMLAAVGSACNTVKDAQSMAFPLTIVTIIPMMLWWQITQSPNSVLAIVLSYIPPITPFIMILRICADPETPLLQIVTTLIVLWAAVFATVWAAARIFRVGVLMYGKPPSLGELLRWVKFT